MRIIEVIQNNCNAGGFCVCNSTSRVFWFKHHHCSGEVYFHWSMTSESELVETAVPIPSVPLTDRQTNVGMSFLQFMKIYASFWIKLYIFFCGYLRSYLMILFVTMDHFVIPNFEKNIQLNPKTCKYNY